MIMNMPHASKNTIGESRWICAPRTASLAAALMVAGCGVLPDKPPRATLYDFGPGTVAAAPASAPTLPPIALADVDATSRLDGTQMLYRLGYADANELHP